MASPYDRHDDAKEFLRKKSCETYAAGVPTRQRQVTDPERIRAMAHPTRLELLDFLTDVEVATATECAAHIGESVASCSFHLRMLEKYGYVERAPQRGREKPWRKVSSGWDMRPAPDQPGSRTAVAELAALQLSRQSERLHRFLAQIEREAEDWVQASTITTSSFWATADELAEFSRDLRALSERFAGRADDPSLRPPGARMARVFATVNPDPAPAGE
jgi:predicted ArsR family transcriptional regulator